MKPTLALVLALTSAAASAQQFDPVHVDEVRVNLPDRQVLLYACETYAPPDQTALSANCAGSVQQLGASDPADLESPHLQFAGLSQNFEWFVESGPCFLTSTFVSADGANRYVISCDADRVFGDGFGPEKVL